MVCRILRQLELLQQVGVGAGRLVDACENLVSGDANISPHRVAEHRWIARDNKGSNVRGDCAFGVVKRASSLFAMGGAVERQIRLLQWFCSCSDGSCGNNLQKKQAAPSP